MKSKLEIEYEVLNINTLSEIEKKLFEKAKNSRLKAYAPYSKFLVGCSILLENAVDSGDFKHLKIILS